MISYAALLLLLNGPAIKVQDQSGKTVAPFALVPAKPTVLMYVMIGCPISAKYSPAMVRLSQAYPGVRFFLVQTEKGATVAQALAHKKEFSIPFSELLDPRRELVGLAKPDTVPTVALFDASGTLRYKGRVDDRFPALGVERAPRRQDLRIAIEEVLAGRRVSVASTPVVGCALPPG